MTSPRHPPAGEPHRGRYVAYYRVSTSRQGQSGLGLEAQQRAVEAYLDGGTWKLLQELTEVETGKGAKALDRRPVLREALEYAKKHRATLIIARLDRLARSVAFVSGLMESGVDFVAADMPNATPFMLHIYAAVAEEEGRAISSRTKAALAAAKARGVRLGNPRLHIDNSARIQSAQDFAERLQPTIEAWRSQGLTQRAMVTELNRLGVKAPRGGRWRSGVSAGHG